MPIPGERRPDMQSANPRFNGDPEDLVLWPDGTCCYREDVAQYRWMSDDYEIISVTAENYLERHTELMGADL